MLAEDAILKTLKEKFVVVLDEHASHNGWPFGVNLWAFDGEGKGVSQHAYGTGNAIIGMSGKKDEARRIELHRTQVEAMATYLKETLAVACLQDGSPWAGFKEGSWIEVEKTVTAGKTVTVSTGRTTIAALTDDEATLTVEWDVGGKKTKETQKVSLKTPPPPRPCDPSKGRVTGHRTMKVGGKDYACDTLDMADGMSTKISVCKDVKVNGGILSFDRTLSRDEMEVGNITALEEKVRVGKGDVTTWVWKQANGRSDRGVTVCSSTWTSAEVPGGLVRSEAEVDERSGGPSKTVIRLTAFEAKK